MSENRNWANLGEQFGGTLSDALSTGDFTGLMDLVTDTVNGAISEAKNQIDQAKELQREKVQKQYFDWQDSKEEREQRDRDRRESFRQEQERRQRELQERQRQWHQERRERSVQEARARQAARTPRQIGQDVQNMIRFRKVGNVSGILCIVFGIIGISVAALVMVPASFAFLFGNGLLGPLISGLVIGLCSIGLLNRGTKLRDRLKRAERYIQLCGYKMYGTVAELAEKTGKSLRYVRKDLRRMLKMGFFPEGHLDDQETNFMLNDAIYHQYQQTNEAYRQAEEEARRLAEAANAPKSMEEQLAEEQSAREAELNAMVSEGMEYIRRLRELNDNIPGEPISGKLYQLENLLKEIFDRVRDHPEQMHRMHKLMEYYLPTTLKLVEAYKEFGEVSVPGEDIRSAMAEIEKTLDTINEAFKSLLNELFQDAALDVTTDAQVLQTMLAREGLTRELDPLSLSGIGGNTDSNITLKTGIGGQTDE